MTGTAFTRLTLNSANLARLLSDQGPEGGKVHARVRRAAEQIADQAQSQAPPGEGYRTIVFDDTTTPGRAGAFTRRRLAVMLTHPDPQARGAAHTILLAAMDAAR
ncbi:MAG: hypothetical protein AB7I38_14440 [Dehalococcoidia bacterium]